MWLLVSKSPPSCGELSATKSVFTVSNVGSAPLFARKNLPSLDDVPCGSLASVTASFAILSVVTALSLILDVVTALLSSFALITSPLVIFALVIALSAILAVLTEASTNLLPFKADILSEVT